ncbi:MAG: gamma carbonic anhydrase family protein [Phycisphaeraceae bacterium]
MRRINGVYVADTARVLGEVELAANVNLWYGVIIRGDVAPVTIGARTNVQDNAAIHCDWDEPNVIGADVTIGHGAIVHGREIGEGTLIGMGTTVLAGTKIGKRCLIAAGAVVTPGFVVPDGMVVMGVPGKIVRETTDQEKKYLSWSAARYVQEAKLHHEQPADVRVKPWGR